MRFFKIVFLLCLTFLFLSCDKSLEKGARKIIHKETLHGVENIDPYRWLEKSDDSIVLKWAREQDSIARNQIQTFPARTEIMRSYEKNAKGHKTDPPQETKTFYVYTETNQKYKNPTVYSRSKSKEEQELIFDSEIFREGWVVKDIAGTPHHDIILLSISKIGSKESNLLIFDVKNKTVLKELEKGSFSKFPWIDANRFVYKKNLDIVCYDVSTKNTRIVYQAKEQTVVMAETNNSRGLVVVSEGVEGNNITVLDINRETQRKLFKGAFSGETYEYMGAQEDIFYFKTNQRATNFRVISYNLRNGEIRDIISEMKYPISQAFVFGEYLVLYYLEVAKPILKVFDLSGAFQYEMKVPVGLAWSNYSENWQGFSGSVFSTTFFYKNLGLTSKGAVYAIDLPLRKQTLFSENNVKGGDKYITTQVFVPIKNSSEEMSMFITHRPDIELNGSHPALLYVYGSYGFTEIPFFNAKYQTFLEMGGIHVMPNVRGGGARGDDWYRAGLKKQKKNTISDIVSAAEWLIENNYSSEKKIVIDGNSAGSIVAMAAINIRPEIFGAGILEVPIGDLLRASLNTKSSLWKSQFGNPEIKEEFDKIYAYSPYQHVNTDSIYPPIFIAPGSIDKVAPPGNAYKLYAKLSENKKNEVYLRINWGGDHSGGDQKKRDAERIDELIFLQKVLFSERPY